MADGKIEEDYWKARTSHIRKILERNGPFSHPQFIADETVMLAIS